MSVIVALTLGLLSPVFPQAHAAHRVAAQRLVACHPLTHGLAAEQPAAGRAAAHPDGSDAGKHGNLSRCPDCCLAAHAGAAVLPQRDAVFARPLRAAVARIRYFAVSERTTNSAPIAAANGARAPPAA